MAKEGKDTVFFIFIFIFCFLLRNKFKWMLSSPSIVVIRTEDRPIGKIFGNAWGDWSSALWRGSGWRGSRWRGSGRRGWTGMEAEEYHLFLRYPFSLLLISSIPVIRSPRRYLISDRFVITILQLKVLLSYTHRNPSIIFYEGSSLDWIEWYQYIKRTYL